MWIKWVVCAPCDVETLSVSQRRQAAPPCWRRWGHLDAEDATRTVIGSMTVRRDGLCLLIPRFSSHLQPNLLCSFHICCFSASTRLCFPPSFCLIRGICTRYTLPPAVISTFPPHGRLAEECLRGGTCMNCSWSLCKGVTPRPPSSLSLIAACISKGEPCLLNRVSVWFSALSVRVLFYSGLGSLRRHSPVQVTLKVDALSWFISVTQPASEKFGKLTSLRACRWMLGEAETTGAALMQSNSPLTGKGRELRDWAV